MPYEIRKWLSVVEEVHHDGGEPVREPLVKAAVGVVLRNPFAGRWVEDLSPLTAPSAELGSQLGDRAASLLGARPVQGYGKGGVVGTAGEQEHVVACLTTVFGDAFRKAVGGGAAWISSVTKTGSAGVTLDIPLAYKDALYVRSHYDAVTLRLDDAPRPDELVVAVAVSSRGRVHHRVGGLSVTEAVGDGVR
jgi:Amino acid synthesis